MLHRFARNHIERVLADSDVQLDGSRPWDIQIHDPSFLRQLLLRSPSLVAGEAYMDGKWSCEAIDEMVFRLLNRNRLMGRKSLGLSHLHNALRFLYGLFTNMQSLARSSEVGKVHYDLGNDLFALMLDKRMIYSCGYWKNAKNLDEAQENKLRLVLDKLKLKPGMRILDVGCGWGGAAKYAAENYGVEVTGITISKEQAKLAKETCKNASVDIQVRDYREIQGNYDGIYSIGMLEHVGYKNLKAFAKKMFDCLKDKHHFVLHTITKSGKVPADPWINKYIFPNADVPALPSIIKATENLFVLEDLQNLCVDYAKTLKQWHANCKQHRDELDSTRYDERFWRMWQLYLLSFVGNFRRHQLNVHQFVFCKGFNTERYDAPR